MEREKEIDLGKLRFLIEEIRKLRMNMILRK